MTNLESYNIPHNFACYESVPEEVFTNGFDDEGVTPSGNTLRCKVNESAVSIFDVAHFLNGNDPLYRFTAKLARNSTISFYMRNRDPSSQTPEVRHPDIRPSCLAIRSLEYFMLQHASPITTLQTEWHPSLMLNDNWLQYRENLEDILALGQRPSDEEIQEAARDTDSGRRALRLGFDGPVIVAERRDGVTQCSFTRSRAAAQQHADALRAFKAIGPA